MNDQLAPVYLNNAPISLLGDEARPPLSRIVLAGGQRPRDVEVQWLTSAKDTQGRPVAQEEIVDRTTDPTTPIYLRSIPKAKLRSVVAARPKGPALGPLQTSPSGPDSESFNHNAAPLSDRARLRDDSRKPHHSRFGREVQRAESEAAAEAEAEQRQEEQRGAQDELQDETEDLDHEFEDRE